MSSESFAILAAACIRLITDTALARLPLPWHRVRCTAGQPPSRWNVRPWMGLHADEELTPAPDNHPLLRLLLHPSSEETVEQLWRSVLTDYVAAGMAFLWAPSDERGMPKDLFRVPPQWVCLLRERGELKEYQIRRPLNKQGDDTHVAAMPDSAIPVGDCVTFVWPAPYSKSLGYPSVSPAWHISDERRLGMDRDQVCAIFGVPTLLLDETAGYDEHRGAMDAFKQLTVNPMLDALAMKLTGHLASRFGDKDVLIAWSV